MSRSYPIWNEIESCIYSGGKSYGVKDHGSVNVKIGTSAKNSHPFLNHTITRADIGEYTLFRFSVDGKIIKSAWLHKKTGDLFFKKPKDAIK